MNFSAINTCAERSYRRRNVAAFSANNYQHTSSEQSQEEICVGD